MPTARLEIEYDGTGFAGWAAQPGLRTVQGELERALATVLRRPVALTVAGRTDRGVHAWGQVASYDGDTVRPRSLNALLGPDVSVRSCARAPDGFDARRDAVSRSYCYRIVRRRERSVFEARRALWWPHRVDLDALDACAAALVGRHDFTAFTPTQTDHVRFERDVLDARWQADGELLSFWITADAFMRHMNRTLVGTMLEVAGGRRTPEGFRALLSGRPRAEAGETAPAHGLYLASVGYPESTELPRAARRVADALAARGHSGAIRVLERTARSAEEAAAALGVEVRQIVKSLVFRAPASDRALLVLVDGAHQVDLARLAEQVGEDVERPDADWVRERTGFAIGGIPPVGHDGALHVVIDPGLVVQQTVWAAAGTPHAVFPVAGDELARITDGRVAPVARTGATAS